MPPAHPKALRNPIGSEIFFSASFQPTSRREEKLQIPFLAKDDEYRRQLEDRLYPAVHVGCVVYDLLVHLGEPCSKPVWA